MKKNMTTVSDLVLIYMEDQPLSFARVENISPDIKPGWFQIKLLVLQIPPTIVTWILRDSYIDGEEYTMGGKRMRIEKVIPPDDEESGKKEISKKTNSEQSEARKSDRLDKPKVISLADLKKRS